MSAEHLLHVSTRALYNFCTTSKNQICLTVGDELVILDDDLQSGWWYVRNLTTKQDGFVPASYVDSSLLQTEIGTVHINKIDHGTEAMKQINNSSSDSARFGSNGSNGSNGNGLNDSQDAMESSGRVKYHYWAWNMAVTSSLFQVLCGIAGVKSNAVSYDATIGTVTIVCGVVCFFFEMSNVGRARTGSKFPLRGLVYLLLAFFQASSVTTICSSIFCFSTAIMQFVACFKGDVVVKDSSVFLFSWEKEAGLTRFNLEKYSWSFNNYAFLYSIFVIHLFINVIIFGVTYSNFVELVWPRKFFAGWPPFIGATGSMLDYNISIIVVPMFRCIWKDLSSLVSGRVSLVTKIPGNFGKRLHNHIALYVGFISTAHLFAVLMEYGQSNSSVSVWMYISGFCLSLFLFLIYTSSFADVKEAKYEFFWYTHYLSLMVFLFTAIHGQNGWSSSFYKFVLAPLGFMLIEQYFRYYQNKRSVNLLSVSIVSGFICLEFDKTGVFSRSYYAGQYIMMRCRSVSEFERHPFSIASAPCESTVKLYIRVRKNHSWTHRLADYLSMMIPNKSFSNLYTRSNFGTVPGKILGPNGNPLFEIEGPYSGPHSCMHSYSSSLIVAGGVGAMSMASVMIDTIFDRFNRRGYVQNLKYRHFCWMVPYQELNSYMWFLSTMRDCDEEYQNLCLNAEMNDPSFAINIYVTSAPTDATSQFENTCDPETWGRPIRRSSVNSYSSDRKRVDMKYTNSDLYFLCRSNSSGQLGNIKVWKSRPVWEDVVRDIGNKQAVLDAGICVCANGTICEDIENACAKVSKERNQNFYMHYEKF